MKKIILVLLLVLVGCTPYWNGVCRHNALFAGAVVGEHLETYVITGRTPSGEYHAQSIMFLEVIDKRVIVGRREFKIDDIKIFTYNEYVAHMSILRNRRAITKKR